MARGLIAVALGIGICACASEAPPARPAATAATATPAATPAPPASPVSVWINADASEGKTASLARDWAKELEAVLAASPGQFRIVKSEEEAELAVRIERIATPKEAPGHQVMTLALAVDGKPARFTLDYTGGPTEMAGKLARFLAGHVERVRGRAASAPASPATSPPAQPSR